MELLDYLGNSMTYNAAKPILDKLDKCIVEVDRDELLDILCAPNPVMEQECPESLRMGSFGNRDPEHVVHQPV